MLSKCNVNMKIVFFVCAYFAPQWCAFGAHVFDAYLKYSSGTVIYMRYGRREMKYCVIICVCRFCDFTIKGTLAPVRT